MKSPREILLVGTGALASLFGARLAQAGVRVTLLGTWPQALEALASHGIRILERNGVEKAFPVTVSASPAELGEVAYAVVLVKAWQTERAAQQLRACLAPDGVALTLQNGYGNRETLARMLGSERVALGVTTTGATLIGPGQVRPGGTGVISLEASPRLQPLIEVLFQAGFQVETTTNVDGLVWHKLGINAAINPLTALLEIPNGALLTRPAALHLMTQLAQETEMVARALGVQLPQANLGRAAREVAERTAENHSSMLQDIRRKAPTEIDAICGAVVALGERFQVPTPTNDTLWRLVKAKVNG